MAELWNPVIIAVLFWGFVNEVITVGEARRFYGLITICGNIAGIVAGQAAGKFTANVYVSWIPYGKNNWDQSILFLGCSIMICSLATLSIFRWMNKRVFSASESLKSQPKNTDKQKSSVFGNIMYLARSKYLVCIAAIVVGYNLAMNLIEVLWKNQIKEAYPNPSDYTAYMGDILTIMGAISTLVAIFFTGSLIRRSWTLAALIPVAVILVTGSAFFFFSFSYSVGIQWIGVFFGMTPLMLSIVFGSLQQVMTRACKYTLFDATKEMAFVPLDSKSKYQGKAAIDGLGVQLGKSGGSIVYQGVLLMVSTVTASIPYVGAIFFAVVLIWFFAVLTLGKQFDVLAAEDGRPGIS